MRLAVVGGGGFRVPLVFEALLGESAALGVREVVLHDVDRSRLAVVNTVLGQMRSAAVDPPTVAVTTDLDEALDGVDVVFSAIRVGGLAGRAADERVAHDLGLLGQETTGPGGVAYGLRTVPVVHRLADRVASVAPDAWVLNFTNPAGLVTEVMSRVLGDRVIGICDSPAALCRRVARAVGVDPSAVWFDYVGLNHLGWLRRALVRGHDELPALLGDDDRLRSFEEGRLFDGQWLRALRAVPNEYLWYWYSRPQAVRASRAVARGAQLREQQEHFYDTVASDPSCALAEWRRVRRERDASYLSEARLPRTGTVRDDADVEGGGYERVAIDVLRAITRSERSVHILGVRNRGVVGALDDDAVVEVPCLVDANGAHPVAVEPPDPHQLALMQAIRAVEHEIVAATSGRSWERALRAFALHPLVDSVARARALLDAYVAADPMLAQLLR